jgi:TetR/AcrR family transcriptional regulator
LADIDTIYRTSGQLLVGNLGDGEMVNSLRRSRDSARSRARILDVAERQFAEKGFAATSIRDLAEASGTSKALIHHHFGNKEDLYVAVKQAVIDRYKEAQRPQLAPDAEPAQFFVEGMRTLFNFYRENPDLVRLGTWTLLEGSTARWPGDEELTRLVIDRMQDAQRQGVIRDDIHPVLLMTMAGALAFSWWQFKAAKRHLLEFLSDRANLDDLYLECMLAVLLHGVAGPALQKTGRNAEPATESAGPREAEAS